MNYILSIKNFNLKSFLLLLYCLIPLSLVTGSFIPDLFVSIISVTFLYYCLKEKIFSYFNNKFFLIFIIFYFILILSSIINNLIFNNLIIFYIRFGIFVIATSYLIQTNKSFINILFFSIFFTLLILCFDSYFQYFFGINFSGNEYPGIYSNDHPRLNSFFGKEYKLGSFIVRLLPFFIFIYLKTKVVNKFIIFFLLLLLSGVIFLSGERSSFLLLFIIIFFLFFYKKTTTVLFVAILFLILFFLYHYSAQKGNTSRIIHLSSSIFSKSINVDADYKTKFARIITDPYSLLNTEYKSIYSNSIKIFKDNIFFGSGPKSYRIVCKNYNPEACTTHSHQTYLQLLAETGLFGFLLMLFIFFYSLFSYFKNIKNNSYVSLIYLGILINIWPMTSSGNLFNNWLSVIIFFPIAFLLKNKKI